MVVGYDYMYETEPEATHINIPGHFYVTVDHYEDNVEIAVRSKSLEAATHVDLPRSRESLQEEIAGAVAECVKYIIMVVNTAEPTGPVN